MELISVSVCLCKYKNKVSKEGTKNISNEHFSCFIPFWSNHSDVFHWKCFYL